MQWTLAVATTLRTQNKIGNGIGVQHLGFRTNHTTVIHWEWKI